MNYKRSDVYLVQENDARGSEIKKTRPWILVGADPLNKARSTLIAVPLSTQAKEIPGLSIKIFLNGVTCCAILDQLRALDKSRFIQKTGAITHHEMQLINEGLRRILNL